MKYNIGFKDKENCKKIKLFKQLCLEEFVDIPCNYPTVEQVVSVVVDPKVVSIKSIDTMEGMSYEGQFLSGKKIVVEIKFKQKVMYVADMETQSVHVYENIFYQSAYIVIPKKIEGTDPAALIKNNMLKCNIDIEDTFVKKISDRKLFKNICILINIVILPTYEICCSKHKNCTSSGLFIMNNDGTHKTAIAPYSKYKNIKPRWSPNGRQIAFIRNKSHRNLCIYSLNNRQNKCLPLPSKYKGVGNFSWYPDSTKIFFSAYKKNIREIFFININNFDIKQLTHGNGIYKSYYPKCSPCGENIAYISTLSGMSDIWIMNKKGMNCTKITSCGCIKSFDWTPDGKNIIYVCGKNGKKDHIHFINIECMKDKIICLPQYICHIKKVSISPSGKYFAFISYNSDKDNIFTYNLSSKKLTNITHSNRNAKISDYVWSADSDKIYYSSKDPFYFNIYKISLVTKRKIQITNCTASKIELSYRPKIC